jgi:hypothetical protein
MPLKINVKKFSRSNVNPPNPPPITEDIPESEYIPEPEPVNINEEEEEEQNYITTNTEDDLLNDLNNINYTEPPTQQELKEQEKTQKQMKKDQEKQEKEFLKQIKNKDKKEIRFNNIVESNNDIFSDIPTEIIGRDKRTIINKITQYKNLFPKELNKFKVKKNCNLDELKAYLSEVESIVESSSVDSFITDSILQCLKLVEGGSKYTRYDITGLSELLKANPQFHSLLKQLYCKYNCFNKIPPEMSLLLVVTTSAYVCFNKNRNKKQFEQYLNEPMKT